MTFDIVIQKLLIDLTNPKLLVERIEHLLLYLSIYPLSDRQEDGIKYAL